MRKHFKKRFTAALLALCLVFTMASSVYAADTPQVNIPATATAPAAEQVKNESQLTAEYVLNNTNFSDISDTSKFYNTSRNLILIMRSGINCDEQAKQYMSAVKSLLNSDGTLNLKAAGYENDIWSSYSCLLITLALAGEDASDFNGANIIKVFNDILKSQTSDSFSNSKLNPYFLGIINSAVTSYSNYFNDYETISSVIKTALINNTVDDKGIDNWGFSVDNNALVYPHFIKMYDSDKDIKAMIDKVLAYTEKTYFDTSNGTSHTVYNDWITGALVDEPNPDATALAIALYSQFGKSELAAKSYYALLDNYKSQNTPGAYTYYGADSLFSTVDALHGLVSYNRILNGLANPFDVTSEAEKILDNSESSDNQGSKDDTPENNSSDNNTNENDQSETTADNTASAAPKTGDNDNPYKYVFLIILSASAILLIQYLYTDRVKRESL